MPCHDFTKGGIPADPLFTKTWLYPDQEQGNPVHESLFKYAASYMNEIFRNIEFDGTKQKIID